MGVRFDMMICDDGRFFILKFEDGKETTMHGPFNSMKRAYSFCRQEKGKRKLEEFMAGRS